MKDGKNHPGVLGPKDIQYGEYPKNMLEDSQTVTSRKNPALLRLKLVTSQPEKSTGA